MTQQFASALDQCFRICSGSPVIMFLLAAALIYLATQVFYRARKSI